MFNLPYKRLSIVGSAMVFMTLLVLFINCENPIGLGSMVNTETPVISMPDDSDNAPGAFLQGSGNRILLEVEQPFGLSEVFMTV